MRKYINTLMAAAIAVATTFSLASCSKDEGSSDDPDTPTPPETEKTVKEATLTNSFYVSQEVLDAFDIVATSDGKDLEFSKELMTTVQSTEGKTISLYAITVESTNSKLPISSTINLNFAVKDGFDVPEVATFYAGPIASGTITYTEGEPSRMLKNEVSSMKVKKEDFDTFVDTLNSKFGYITATLNESGAFIEGSSDDPDTPTPPETEKTVKEATLTNSFYVSQEVLDAFDIVATFDGKDLEFSKEPVTTVQSTEGETISLYAITVESTNSELPISSTINLKFAVKDGFDAPEVATFYAGPIASGTITYTEGEPSAMLNNEVSSWKVKKENFEKLVDTLNSKFGYITATLNESGAFIERGAAE